MEQVSRERPSATRHSRVPGHNPSHRSADRFTCSHQLCPRGSTATHPPSFSPATPVQTPFCLSFPSKVSRNTRRALVKQRPTGAAPSPRHVVCVPTQNVLGGSPRTDPTSGRPLPPPQPRPPELLNHVLGSGCRRPGLPAASTHDPLLPAAAASCERSWESGSAGAPAPARAALLSSGTCFPRELRCSSKLAAGLRAAARSPLWGQGL